MAILARTIGGSIALAAALAVALPARADLITLTPVDNGSLFECPGCNFGPARTHLLVGGDFVGDIMFQQPSTPVVLAQLLVNPWALPLSGLSMTVYAKASSSGVVSQDDTTGATNLGIWTLPNLALGQDASFDVTSFVSTVTTRYVDFTLYSGGLDIFSSLASNYGHPSQLAVTSTSTAVHEPSSLAIMVAGFAGLCVTSRRKTAARAPSRNKPRA